MIIVSISEESNEIIPNLKPSEGMQIQLLQEAKTVNVKNMTEVNLNTDLSVDGYDVYFQERFI